MNDTRLYGKLSSEKLLEENKKAHQIVKVIGDYGVSDRERWLIIYYLALELEDFEKMRELIAWVKENNTQLFINTGENDGQINT